mmetsp:Transcript_7696/g.10550  ORF Transcript_7696/g.10550 Transcript_7696/m.10550 type:complete len:189 (+) Transcript_7696:247-813(+)|eukprot:CAMPEP_0185261358 /NCGR_PEP_ID=MMETSP1359-20130426/9755_1 /TAXON_ID=552665 /ORGANISM="Bigelowiella longifila, Strain CCMP242" /LENGTH=188 /DNA_ID=CAMNT_0027847941 /DNA_START=205 /DNA_END=771 /DNA_ORIENTATION=+
MRGIFFVTLTLVGVWGGWTKKPRKQQTNAIRPAPNTQRGATSESAGANQKNFVRRINNTHAFVTDMDEEMKDIFHRIRKKATGMETLTQEAALLQVERIRKQTGNSFFEPIVKAEPYAGANSQQAVKTQEKSIRKASHTLNADNIKQKIASLMNNKNAWVIETPDMMSPSGTGGVGGSFNPNYQTVYI